jgi:hypothetical protein
MGDVGDDFNAFREDAKVRNRERSDRFLLKLEEAGVPYKSTGNGVLLIRYAGLSVDLYSTRGRWKDNSTGRLVNGDEGSFINWIGKRIA